MLWKFLRCGDWHNRRGVAAHDGDDFVAVDLQPRVEADHDVVGEHAGRALLRAKGKCIQGLLVSYALQIPHLRVVHSAFGYVGEKLHFSEPSSFRLHRVTMLVEFIGLERFCSSVPNLCLGSIASGVSVHHVPKEKTNSTFISSDLKKNSPNRQPSNMGTLYRELLEIKEPCTALAFGASYLQSSASFEREFDGLLKLAVPRDLAGRVSVKVCVDDAEEGLAESHRDVHET